MLHMPLLKHCSSLGISESVVVKLSDIVLEIDDEFFLFPETHAREWLMDRKQKALEESRLLH
jgi:hypothetical protein